MSIDENRLHSQIHDWVDTFAQMRRGKESIPRALDEETTKPLQEITEKLSQLVKQHEGLDTREQITSLYTTWMQFAEERSKQNLSIQNVQKLAKIARLVKSNLQTFDSKKRKAEIVVEEHIEKKRRGDLEGNSVGDLSQGSGVIWHTLSRIKDAILNVLWQRAIAVVDFNAIQLTESEQKLLLEAWEKQDTPGTYAEYTIFKGGMHVGIIMHSLPGVIFKTSLMNRRGDGVDKEIERFQKARAFCQEHTLDALKIPQCGKHVLHNQLAFLAQEKMEVESDWHFQKGLYRYMYEQPEKQEHVKKCFLQLAKFICAMGFGDVKYDNIPLVDEGIVLYDLDSTGVAEGLVYGVMPRSGLLNYSPTEEVLNEALVVIRKELEGSSQSQQFEEAWKHGEVSIRERIRKRGEKRQRMKDFLVKQGITSANPSQCIDSEKVSYSANPEIESIQKTLITMLNEGLKTARNPDFIQFRRLQIDLKEVVGKEWDRVALVEQALDGLKKSGVIAHYRFSVHFFTAVVRC